MLRENEERALSKRLRSQVRKLLYEELTTHLNPWWYVSFHYRENHCCVDKVIADTGDLKKKLRRLVFKARDLSVVGEGGFPYPKMLFVHETSHQGTGQLHTHLVLEALPQKLNTHQAVTKLFTAELPQRVKSLSSWKSIDVQRINDSESDLRRLSSYLTKQNSRRAISLDAFNSDLRSSR